MRTALRMILCWPLFFGTLVALVVRALWGSSMRWESGVLVTELSPTSWPMRSWYKAWSGTTFGYGIMLAPGKTTEIVGHRPIVAILDHELVHVEQFEAATLGGLVMGALVLAVVHSAWGLAGLLVCWMTSCWFAYLGATFAAWLRSEPNAYRGNHLEEAAYNATDVKCRAPS